MSTNLSEYRTDNTTRKTMSDDQDTIDFPSEPTPGNANPATQAAVENPKYEPPPKPDKPADPDKFQGKKLAPFSGARRTLASKMGMRIMSAGEDTWLAFQTRGLYDQILSDACLCVWICLQNQGAIVRGMINPGKAIAEWCEWLEKHNFQTYDATLQGAFTHLIGPMLEQVKDGSCAVMIEEDPCGVDVGAQTFTGNYEAVTDDEGETVHSITLTNADADPLGIGIGDEMEVSGGGGKFKVVEIDALKAHTIYGVDLIDGTQELY